MNNDDDLRQLFQDATADIRPQGTLDDIRAQTKKVDPMARRWFLPSLAAAAVMAMVIGGAFWATRDTDADKNSPNVAASPDVSPSPSETPTTTPPSTRAIPVYYAGNTARGKRLFREFQKLAACPSIECALDAAVGQSLDGAPLDHDYVSLWPKTRVLGTSYTDDLITIDLPATAHDRPASMARTVAELAIQQAIFTAEAAVGKGRLPVQFLLDGKHTDTVLGVPTSEPLAAGDELDVLAPVQISSPADGATVAPGDLKVTGVAAVFEANVAWELLVGGDAQVLSGYTTAEECCRLAPYSFTIKDLKPGRYTLVVHDNDESGQGLPVNQDTKEIVVE